MSRDIKTYSAKERIISKGEHGDKAYQVLEGTAHVFLEDDGKIVSLATLEKGAIFGEMALFGASEYGAHVEAAEDNTEIQVVTSDTLHKKLDSCDPIIKTIFLSMMDRLRDTNKALFESETREFIEIDLI